MLHAACSSPTARQSLASCVALLMSSWVSPPAGSRIATAEDLAPLVETLRAACPDLAAVEDYVPLDPRWLVRFRAASEDESWDFRVHPGGLESPLQVLQAVVNYAEALDPVLVPRFGYGVAGMLHVAGRMLDAELAILAPEWGDESVSLESTPTVTGAEVAAAANYLDKWRSGGVLPVGLAEFWDDDDGRLARAARGLTIDYRRLSFGAGLGRGHIGPAFFVRGPVDVLPVPAGVILESLTAAVLVASHFLSAHSEVRDEGPERGESSREQGTGVPRVTAAEAAGSAQRWRDRASSDLEWACRALPATILFGYETDDAHELLLIGPGHRHIVAVDLVTGLAFDEINDDIQAARQRLAGFGPGSSFRVSQSRNDQARLGDASGASAPPPGTTDSGIAWITGTADALPFAGSLMTGDAAALAAGTAVTRIVVVDGPWQHGPVWVPEIPVCTLDEFRALLAAQDSQSTDREELWSFLDELATLGADGAGTGCAELICWSILDAWEAWQANGMICPAWVDPGTLIRVPPRDLDDPWERNALLDSVDAILTRFGMGAVREWSQLISTPVPAVRPECDEMSFVVTLSLYVPRRIWWVDADLALLVRADLEFQEGLTFSRAAVGTLANVIEDTLREVARQDPHAWQLWREAHGDHPVAILLTPAQLPQSLPALRFIGMGKMFDQLYADPQRLADLPDAEVHALIGEALTFGMLARLQSVHLGDVPASSPDQDSRSADAEERTGGPVGGDGEERVIELSPSDEDLRRAEMFRTAWQRIRPRLTQRVGASPFRPYELTAAQTLTAHGSDRARRMIARRLRTRLGPGTHPLRAVITELCPGAFGTLGDIARDYAPRAALAAACAELERALSDRFASRAILELNLGSSWAEETFAELDIATPSDETRRSRVAELLTEHLLSQPPAGSLVPDRRDVHQLLDLASAAMEASQDAQYAYAAIRPAEVEVSEFGDIDLVPTGPPRADIRAWQQAQLEDQARTFTSGKGEWSDPAETLTAEEPTGPDNGEAKQQQTLRSMLEADIRSKSGFQAVNAGGLLEVDDQLIEHCGFSLDSVVAVLAEVTSWDVPAEPNPPIAQVTRTALVDAVTARSGLPRKQIDAAVRACSLNAQQIRDEGLRYWQLKERSARLALRPLIEPPDPHATDELWLLPRCAHRTQHLLVSYLNGQQLPWPDRDLPDALRKAVRAWHKLAEDHLETELGTAAGSAGLAFRPNLKENKAAREGLTLDGEIDLLAADIVRRRIWIIEAKHLRQVFSPLEIGSRIADFHGESALATGPDTHQFRQFQGRTFTPYVHRLLANTCAVHQSMQAAIRLINAVTPEPNRALQSVSDWEMIPLIVTTHFEISAFTTDPGVPFVLIDHLRELLSAEQLPSPGWWSPWTD